jgi:glycosyltransferase involved in cell wall biosynthesis
MKILLIVEERAQLEAANALARGLVKAGAEASVAELSPKNGSISKQVATLAPDWILAMGKPLAGIPAGVHQALFSSDSGLINTQMRQFRKGIDLVFCPGPEAIEPLRALGVAQARFLPEVFPSQVPVDAAGRVLLRRRMGLTDENVVVLGQGGGNTRYLIEQFLCATQGLDKAQLWVWGHAPARWAWRAYARLLGGDNISFLSPRKFPLEMVLPAGDLAISLSTGEDSKSFASRALLAGLPILSLRGSRGARLVEEEINGWSVGVDRELLFAGRLRQLLLDGALRDEMSVASGRLAAQHTPEAVARKLLAELAR